MVNARESHRKGCSKSPPQAPIENPNGVPSLSPGLTREATATLGRVILSKLDPEGVTRVQARARLKFTLLSFNTSIPHPKSTLGLVCERLIRVENHLVRTFHKPSTDQKTGPKIRGYIRAAWEAARRICPATAGRRSHSDRASGHEQVQPKHMPSRSYPAQINLPKTGKNQKRLFHHFIPVTSAS